jgi:peptidoglycan/LPS O-acetylase OafA/YrhL
VTTAAVLIATRIWGVPEQWTSIRTDAFAALGYVANWRFVLDDQSYFETLFAPSPLRHTWSLAVEEQWYLVWPLVVAVIAARRRQVAMVALASGAIASALAMAFGYDPADPSTVYYATHTRAQQLLVGALLAWVLHGRPDRSADRRSLSQRTTGLVALCGFVALSLVASDDARWLYHGGFLVVSIWCAVLVHAVASVDGGSLPELAAAPLRRIGERSYAIYLWHWPVIVFVGRPMGIMWSRPAVIALQLLIIALLVEVTHRLVERPMRNRHGGIRAGGPWQPTVSWSAAAVVVALAAAVVLRPPDDRVLATVESIRPVGGPVATPPVTTAPPTTSNVPTSNVPASSAVPTSTLPEPPPPTSTAPVAPRRMLLFGDSTALAVAVGSTITPSITDGWYAESHATLGCGLTPGGAVDVGRTEPTAANEQCPNWVEEWSASIEFVDPDVSVVMVGSWEVLDHLVDGSIVRYPSPEWTTLVTTTMRTAITVARGPDRSIPVLLVELPCMRQEPNEMFSAVARNDPDRVAAFNDILRGLAESDPLVRTVDVAELFCDGDAPNDDTTGRDLRYDGVHVTPYGADLTWRWLAARADLFLSSP